MGTLTQVNMVYTHPADPLQTNAFEFGMNGSAMYGTETPWAKGTYCVQLFNSGALVAGQWPTFDATHKGLNLTGRTNISSCAAQPGAKQIANPVLASGASVKGGSWFVL